jgi:hypothetical protein
MAPRDGNNHVTPALPSDLLRSLPQQGAPVALPRRCEAQAEEGRAFPPGVEAYPRRGLPTPRGANSDSGVRAHSRGRCLPASSFANASVMKPGVAPSLARWGSRGRPAPGEQLPPFFGVWVGNTWTLGGSGPPRRPERLSLWLFRARVGMVFLLRAVRPTAGDTSRLCGSRKPSPARCFEGRSWRCRLPALSGSSHDPGSTCARPLVQVRGGASVPSVPFSLTRRPMSVHR